jgi:hypothetical protein
MAFDPNLADPVSRIRFALGDTGTTVLLPGGETTYTALLAQLGGNERATMRHAAAALATYYATKPNRISDLGSSLSWDERVDQWNRIARGEIDPLPPSDATLVRGPRVGVICAGTGYTPR